MMAAGAKETTADIVAAAAVTDQSMAVAAMMTAVAKKVAAEALADDQSVTVAALAAAVGAVLFRVSKNI